MRSLEKHWKDSHAKISHNNTRYREEKSLRQVAMVAKFLDDNKPKTSLIKRIRTVSNFDDLIHFI